MYFAIAASYALIEIAFAPHTSQSRLIYWLCINKIFIKKKWTFLLLHQTKEILSQKKAILWCFFEGFYNAKFRWQLLPLRYNLDYNFIISWANSSSPWPGKCLPVRHTQAHVQTWIYRFKLQWPIISFFFTVPFGTEVGSHLL